jgi:hypothetical protein
MSDPIPGEIVQVEIGLLIIASPISPCEQSYFYHSVVLFLPVLFHQVLDLTSL